MISSLYQQHTDPWLHKLKEETKEQLEMMAHWVEYLECWKLLSVVGHDPVIFLGLRGDSILVLNICWPSIIGVP